MLRKKKKKKNSNDQETNNSVKYVCGDYVWYVTDWTTRSVYSQAETRDLNMQNIPNIFKVWVYVGW